MDLEKRQQIVSLLRARISDAEIRARSYAFENGKKRPNRNIYVKIKGHFDKFLSGDKSRRWVILTGLRGAGKTTLMSQIYLNAPRDAQKIFLPIDQMTDQSISLREVLSVYETDFLGMSFAQFEKPIFLFLDEIQYDKGWGMALKAIYDNAPNVFIFATGSSALSINMNIDVARRPVFEKVFPLSFCEYKKIKDREFEKKGLGKEMRDIFLRSQSADELFNETKKLEPKINNYLAGIKNKNFDDYITFATLPSLVELGEPILAYDQVKNILDRVVGDILHTGEFNTETLNKIKDILYIAASADKISFSAIGSNTGIQLHYTTVSRIFDILQQAEVLTRVLPFSISHNTQVRQPSKFLFSAPAFRAMYFHLRGSVLSPEEARGKLLEDIVGMYLNRILYKKREAHLNYDAEKGGADFIVGIGSNDIVIEVGVNKKTIKQVINTMKKTQSAFGIVISEKQDILEIDNNYNIVKIPFKYFILM